MVKKIAIALLCTALGTSLYAREDISKSDIFIGLEIGSTKIDSSTKVFLTDDEDDIIGDPAKYDGGSEIEYGIRIGAEKDEWRTTLLYSYYNNDDEGIEETMHKGSLLLDYFIWSSDSIDYNVKPYIGLNVGYMSYEASGDLLGEGNQVYADDSGLFYGAQAGIAMTISEVVQLDLSYRYSLIAMDDSEDEKYLGSDEWLNSVNSLDNMGSIVFSVNYFY